MKRNIELEKAKEEVVKQFKFFELPYSEIGEDKSHNFFVDDAIVYRVGYTNLVYIGINHEDYMVMQGDEDKFTHKLDELKYFIANVAVHFSKTKEITNYEEDSFGTCRFCDCGNNDRL